MSEEQRTRAAVDRFNDAFNRHDVDAVMAAMTADCVFESTTPPVRRPPRGPGGRPQGVGGFFAASPSAHFDAEDVITTGDRCVVQWRYSWTTMATRARSAGSTSCGCRTTRSPRSSPT